MYHKKDKHPFYIPLKFIYTEDSSTLPRRQSNKSCFVVSTPSPLLASSRKFSFASCHRHDAQRTSCKTSSSSQMTSCCPQATPMASLREVMREVRPMRYPSSLLPSVHGTLCWSSLVSGRGAVFPKSIIHTLALWWSWTKRSELPIT